MIKDFLNYIKNQKIINLQENSPEAEFNELSKGLNNFSSLLKKSASKNLILKDYDILDLKIIEFINQVGRTSYYGKKATGLSKQLSDYYSYFKKNINLYVDEPVTQIKKEEPEIDLEASFSDLRLRLNKFREAVLSSRLTEDEVENFILLFNDEIKDLMKYSDKEYKLKFTDLKNKLLGFYKDTQRKNEEHLVKNAYESRLNLVKLKINEFKAKAEEAKKLMGADKKTEQQIIEINNRVFDIKERYLGLKEIIEEKLSEKEKETRLRELNDFYKSVDSLYVEHLEKLSSSKTEKYSTLSPQKKFTIPSFFEILKSVRPSPVLKLKTNKEKLRKKQNLMANQTINIITEVLNNIDIYNTDELKDIFTNNFQVYEEFILNTDYSMLVKTLLDDLESGINKIEEERKAKIKRDVIAKESYALLKRTADNLENYSFEELQIIFEKSLENYKNFSKYTVFGLKITSLLNNLNVYINPLSSRKSVHEDLSKVFLNNLENVAANIENYSIKYLSRVLEKSTEDYNKYYGNLKFSRNIEFSLQNISNTLSLLRILVAYIEKDLSITEKQRMFLRTLIFTTYSQFFSFGSNFLFSISSKKSIRKLEKVFNLEIERKLLLEDLNNKIISLNLSNNSSIKLLINNLINTKKHQSNLDLKETFIELSGKLTQNDKLSLNEAVVKLLELTNSVLPSRKKSLLELKTKLL